MLLYVTTAPDGVKPPVLTSPTPKSIEVQWGAVGRDNANQQPVFQLQFKDAALNALVQEYDNFIYQLLRE